MRGGEGGRDNGKVTMNIAEGDSAFGEPSSVKRFAFASFPQWGKPLSRSFAAQNFNYCACGAWFVGRCRIFDAVPPDTERRNTQSKVCEANFQIRAFPLRISRLCRLIQGSLSRAKRVTVEGLTNDFSDFLPHPQNALTISSLTISTHLLTFSGLCATVSTSFSVMSKMFPFSLK